MNNTTEYNKICNIESKVIKILAWIFFLPVMLVFAAFKNPKFQILLLTLAIIFASLFVVLIYNFIIDRHMLLDNGITEASRKTAEYFESLSIADDTSGIMPKDTIVYITKSGMKYHTADCYVLKGNGIAKRYEDAYLLGYAPCKRCH